MAKENPDERDAAEVEKLTTSLERHARKIEGVNRDSFVDTRSLCGSCRWSTITRQYSKNNRIIRCTEMGLFVPEDIAECNSYSSIATLTLSQMAEMATLVGGKREALVGFKSPH